MLCLHVFRHTGPPQWVDCMAPPPVCHINMEASHLVPYPRILGHYKQACRQTYGTGGNDWIIVVFADVPTSI